MIQTIFNLNASFLWKLTTSLNISSFQIDMSKCMVAFIDWYHLRINASEREKIKVKYIFVSTMHSKYFLK